MSFYDAIRVGASGAADAYEVDQSLRFVRGDAHKLTRTPGSAGNRRTWTWSAWIKTTGDTGENFLFSVVNSGYSGNSEYTTINLYGNKLRLSQATNHIRQANKLFRDPSAWYHIVVKYDSTDSTADDRAILYSNGERLTDLSDNISISENYETAINTTLNHTIGDGISSQAFNGLMAEVNFLDGYAYDPSYFGETNAITGQWVPKKYTGSYGSQGFYLKFADNSSVSALGTDSSGNGNNWTPNAAIVVGDRLKDTPTNNFPTLQMMGFPFASGASFFDVNLQITTGSSGSARNLNRQAFAPMLVNSGKWYAEFMQKSSGGNGFIGVAPYQVMISPTANNTRYAFVLTHDGKAYVRTGSSESISTYGGNTAQYDVIGVYLDMDAGTPVVYFSKNGQWSDGSGNFDESSPTGGITLGDSFFTTDTGGNDGFVAFALVSASGGNSAQFHANFGQDSTFAGQTTAGGNTDENGLGDFKYAVPTGAKALCSSNLPDPTILLPNKHFNSVIWSGNGTNGRTISGVGFNPDWTWIKCRSNDPSHLLYDTVRGGNKALSSNNTDAESSSSEYGYLSAFASDGFTLTQGTNGSFPMGSVNHSGRTYVAWNWEAGETDGKTYTVTVVSDSGNKYRFDGFGTSAVTLDLAEGGTYIFNMDDATNASHPFSIGTAANGTVYTSGITYFLDGVSKTYSQYTSGFSSATTRRLHITVPASAPVLYYWCSAHSGMGGAINTNSTLGSSNFDGSIQSTAKVNASAGFSIVLYTGTGADGTVGHGLGVTPDVVIVKNRDSTQHWSVKHKNLTSGYNVKLNLNEAEGQSTGSTNGIIADLSSSSNFSLTRTGNTGNYDNVNKSGEKHLAYIFSEVAGYSKFGSYRGNGSTDGTFVYTGFKPALVTVKTINVAQNWVTWDNAREPSNEMQRVLEWNDGSTTDGASSNTAIDFLANGFKHRTSFVRSNTDGNTYIYFAFAESPFKNSRAR